MLDRPVICGRLASVGQLNNVAFTFTNLSAVIFTSDDGNAFVLINILPPESIATTDAAFEILDGSIP